MELRAPFRWLVSCGVLAAACGGVEVDLPFARYEAAAVINNDQLLNGVTLNGTTTNGRVLNGRVLNGITLNSATLNGRVLNGTTLSMTRFSTTDSSGTLLTGTRLTGSDFTAVLDDGSTLALHFDKITAGPSPNGDLFLYWVSYQTTTGAQPLCGKDASGNAVAAWPINGRFDDVKGSYTDDSTMFQLACRGGAIAKCLENGYRPWKALPSGTGTYQNHFLACTRMIRADYCGLGKPGTVNGVAIDVYDSTGVLKQATTWGVEAEWGPSGATCVTSDVNHARWYIYGQQKYACWDGARQTDCGTVSYGGLVIDRFN